MSSHLSFKCQNESDNLKVMFSNRLNLPSIRCNALYYIFSENSNENSIPFDVLGCFEKYYFNEINANP